MDFNERPKTDLLLFRKVTLVYAKFNNPFNREFKLVTRNPIYACLLSLQMGSTNLTRPILFSPFFQAPATTQPQGSNAEKPLVVPAAPGVLFVLITALLESIEAP